MILPFMSFSWSPFGGRYTQPFVRVLCDWVDIGHYAATQLKALPKGRRMMCFQNAESGGRLFWHPADRLAGGRKGLWWPAGEAATVAHFGAMIEQMFADKADIDFAVFDIETAVTFYTLDSADLAAIYADPRYAALAASGHFPADPRNMNGPDQTLFIYGCMRLFNDAIKKALITPLYKRYPNVGWCNFSDGPVTKADASIATDHHGNVQYISPSWAPYYAPSMYASVGNLGKFDPRFQTPFYVLAWTCNLARAVYRAKAGAKLMPWLAPRADSNVLDVAHWNELVFHACCLAGPNLLYFNASDPSALANWRFDNAISQYVNQARGRVWKQTLVTDLTSYDKVTYVLTAAKLADDSVVGRVTFKPGVNSVTFTVSGKTYKVTRPGDAVGAWFHS